MASAPAVCQIHGSLLFPGAESGLLASSRDCLSSRKNVSIPLPPCFNGSSRVCSARQHLLLVTAQDGKQGTRLFKFGGKKESSETAEAPTSGTRLFNFGGKKEPTTDEEPKSGTKLFQFGSKKEGTGTAKFKGGPIVPTKDVPSFSFGRRRDPNTVFVAGATGQIGARVTQKLLREGFSVRGGVRDLFVAQQLAEFATQYGVVSREEVKRLNAVEFDFRNVESIARAISSASKVVVTIGPAEDGPKSRVSFSDASSVIEAAKLANIGHLVVVYEPGMAPIGNNPLSGFASFFSELFSPPAALSLSELLSQVVDSQLSYTVLKISPTEGVDDISSELGNIDLRRDGSPVENGKISKSQVASVVATVFSNTVLAENKVVAVTTSAVATSSVAELLSALPTDGRRAVLVASRAKAEEEERQREQREQAKAEARAAQEEALKAAQLAAKLEAEAIKVAAAEARAASFAEKAQAQATAAAASVDNLASKVKELGTDFFKTTKGGLASLSFSSPSPPPQKASPPPQKSTPKPKPKSKPTAPPKKKQREQPTPVASAPAQKPQINSIFGGLFQQETVYVDEA